MKLLSRSEEIILLCIWRLQEDAYGVQIRKEAARTTGYTWSIGAIYAPLHRLERKGLVQTHTGEPVPERGGRSKVYYTLTAAGIQSLVTIRQVHEALWTGIPVLSLEDR